MSDRLTVLVNSTDGFEDCWLPFFRLFQHYWAECPYRIILNTERRVFTYPGLKVECSQTGLDAHQTGAAWSDCLLSALEQITTPYVLYLQEDYFLNGRVDHRVIEQFVDSMDANCWSHIRVVDLEETEKRRCPDAPLLAEVDQRAPYRISLQAGLWRTERLKWYMRPGESGWQFERWGTARAHRIPDTFLCPNPDVFPLRGREIVPYVPTGIIRGRWYAPAVIPLFQQHGIEMDFGRRGFFSSKKANQLAQNCRTAARRILFSCLPLLPNPLFTKIADPSRQQRLRAV